MIAYDNKHPAKAFCRCICGKEKWVNRHSLRRGLSKSCGCQINRYTKDYGIKPGDKIGYWTVLRRGGHPNESKAYFLCRCICGKERWVAAHTLINGTSLSCGCKRTDENKLIWDYLTTLMTLKRPEKQRSSATFLAGKKKPTKLGRNSKRGCRIKPFWLRAIALFFYSISSFYSLFSS